MTGTVPTARDEAAGGARVIQKYFSSTLRFLSLNFRLIVVKGKFLVLGIGAFLGQCQPTNWVQEMKICNGTRKETTNETIESSGHGPISRRVTNRDAHR